MGSVKDTKPRAFHCFGKVIIYLFCVVLVVAATNKVGYEGTNLNLNEFKFLKVSFQNTCVGETIQVLNGRN